MIAAGVIGWPVAHSKSPLIHRFWLAKLGIDGDYGRFAVAPENLGIFIQALPAEGLVGVNVTIPHKVTVLAHLDRVDDHAAKVGAVNTIVIEGATRTGYNTDVAGVTEALRGVERRGASVVIIGAGGAARAALAAFDGAGASEVLVVARDPDKAVTLTRSFDVFGVGVPFDGLARVVATADVVINASPLGMSAQAGFPPEVLAVLHDRGKTTVFDMVYSPLETPLLAAARARGLPHHRRSRHADRAGGGGVRAVLWCLRPPPVRRRTPRAAHRMIVLGLTGSIGMGKSTVAAMFRRLKVPVFDADAAVHALQAPGGAALPAIDAAFPGVVAGGVLDRAALGGRVFGDAAALDRLQAIVHPLVAAAQTRFLRRHRRARLVVLDIPLLFEGGGADRCDLVAVVSAPADVQRARVLARPGMTADKLDAILARQLPDADKRARADVVIPTGGSLLATRRAVGKLVTTLTRAR